MEQNNEINLAVIGQGHHPGWQTHILSYGQQAAAHSQVGAFVSRVYICHYDVVGMLSPWVVFEKFSLPVGPKFWQIFPSSLWV